jgi:hypothetical protein
MASEPLHVDIDDYPDLLRLVEEVEATDKPRLLRRGKHDVALLIPLHANTRRSSRKPTDEDVAAFLAAAGGWKDLVDTEQLKRDVYAARGSDRPPVDL